MRRAAKTDANQSEIVEGLRSRGVSVQSLAAVGEGCPDIVAGWGHVNYLFEIKDSEKPPSQRKLRPKQQEWIDRWHGQVQVIETLEDALRVLGMA